MKTSNPDVSFADQTFNEARRLSEQSLSAAERTFEQTEGKMRSLRNNIDPVVEKLAAQAQKLARQSLDMASEATARAQRSVSRYANTTTRFVANEPVKAVLIAAAVGAAVALLVAAAREHRR